jgi:hypothetical protein
MFYRYRPTSDFLRRRHGDYYIWVACICGVFQNCGQETPIRKAQKSDFVGYQEVNKLRHVGDVEPATYHVSGVHWHRISGCTGPFKGFARGFGCASPGSWLYPLWAAQDAIPNAWSIWLYREQLTRCGSMDRLLDKRRHQAMLVRGRVIPQFQHGKPHDNVKARTDLLQTTPEFGLDDNRTGRVRKPITARRSNWPGYGQADLRTGSFGADFDSSRHVSRTVIPLAPSGFCL